MEIFKFLKVVFEYIEKVLNIRNVPPVTMQCMCYDSLFFLKQYSSKYTFIELYFYIDVYTCNYLFVITRAEILMP